jgi:hypothetical protein
VLVGLPRFAGLYQEDAMIRRPLNALWAAASLFAAACFLTLWVAEGLLTDGPRFGSEEYPLVIGGERLLDCLPEDDRRVGLMEDGVRLYANLDMVFHAHTEGKGSTLYLVARGKRLDDVPPLLTIEVDRKLRGHISVDSDEWALYSFDLEIRPGEHRFRIRYINDRSRFPTNRDVDLKLVALGEPPAGWESSAAPRRPQGGPQTLWKNGHIARAYTAADEGQVLLRIVARGDLCQGAGPRMLIMDNDDQLLSVDVDTTSFEPYETILTLAPGEHEILIVYENDLYVPGVCDRNLHVKEMRLEKP